MRKILPLLASIMLLCSWQSDLHYLIVSGTPAGEVVQVIDGKYHCLVGPGNIPDGARVLSAISSRQPLGKYHDYALLQKELFAMQEKYLGKCAVYDIGTTFEGRTIWALRFEPKKPSPGMLFVGEHHAREWMSVEVPLALAKRLAENPGNDKRIAKWLETYDIWIVPMLNPDGHQFSVDKNRLWRKNRTPFQAGTFGTDPNRNYAYRWGNMGSVANTESDIYPGPKAFSEFETQAIKRLADTIPFLGAITYHTYGNMIIYSWNFGYEMAPYQEKLERIAVSMAKLSGKADPKPNDANAIKDYKYTVMKGTELYAASGDMCDYFYSTYGTPTFTYEMTNSYNGFINSDEEIEPTCDLVIPMSLELFEAVPREFGILHGRVTDSMGNPVETTLHFKNIETPIKTNPETGRFHRVVPLGEHYMRHSVDGKDRFVNVKIDKMMNWVPIVIDGRELFALSGRIVDRNGSDLARTAALYDQKGKEIAKSSNSSKFSFKGLPKGSYILKVFGTDGTDSHKITLVRDMEFEASSN